MANGNAVPSLSALLKILFGDVPAQWVRQIAIGAIATMLYFSARDFKNEMKAEGLAARRVMNEYIAANDVWQKTSAKERVRLLRAADARIGRLYAQNGWVYEPLRSLIEEK